MLKFIVCEDDAEELNIAVQTITKSMMKYADIEYKVEKFQRYNEKLENYQNAKKVLNKGLKMNKNSIEIWVHAAMLEEANSINESKVNSIVSKAFDSFNSSQITISNDEWINEAIKAEKSSSLLTSTVIIKNLIAFSIEKTSFKEARSTFLNFTEKVKGEGCIETLKAI